MKKLMIAAAAAAMIGGAYAIESANIVGYSLITVPKGFSFRSVIFKNVSGESFDLTSLQVKKNTGAEYGTTGMASIKASGFTIRKISASGAYLEPYHYITCVSGSGAVAQKGWYKNGTELVESGVTINDGEGIILYTAKTDAALLMNGEVDLVCKTTITKGFNFAGNSTPTAINLTEMSVIKSNGSEYGTTGMASLKASGFTVRKIATSGAYGEPYHYITCVSGSGSVAQKGWYKNGTELVTSENDLTFEPGEGCIVYTAKTDAVLVLPKPVAE